MLITNEEDELRDALTFTDSVIPERISADPEIVENGLARLVLSIIELIRRLLEKQAMRRMDAGNLTDDEIEREVIEKLACDVVSESRVQREGAFPQINVLIDRDEESRLQELHASLADRYVDQGVTLAITGPWPPYTFANA